jgi:hypothetical protein
MRYIVELTSDGMIYIPSFMKIGLDVEGILHLSKQFAQINLII